MPPQSSGRRPQLRDARGRFTRAGGSTSTRVVWSGDRQVKVNIRAYGDKVRQAVRAVADYWAPVLEAYAKTNAPWTDRTSNARQGLHAFVDPESKDVIVLYLSHGAGLEYTKFLETRWQGRWGIIAPTLEAHYGQIAQMLQEIFS